MFGSGVFGVEVVEVLLKIDASIENPSKTAQPPNSPFQARSAEEPFQSKSQSAGASRLAIEVVDFFFYEIQTGEKQEKREEKRKERNVEKNRRRKRKEKEKKKRNIVREQFLQLQLTIPITALLEVEA